MTGPEHYKEAERILESTLSPDAANRHGFSGWSRLELVGLAQAHAQLSEAAVLALEDVPDERERAAMVREWNQVIA